MIEKLFDNIYNTHGDFIGPVFLISICIAIIIQFIRAKIIAYKPEIEENKHYRELFLPLLPFVIGIILYTILDNYTCSKAAVYAGLIAGGISGTSYQIVKGYLKRLDEK